MKAPDLITEHLDLWTGAVTTKSTAGRGRNGKIELTGIKKLRELILELAVRGKLVEQDPNDEPADTLLERIAAEKASLVKDGKFKSTKTPPTVSVQEEPFDLPPGWSWTRLGIIAQINPRNDADDTTPASFVSMPMISTSYDGCHEQEQRPWGEIKKGYTHIAEGDIAIAKITPCFENSKAAVFTNLSNGIGAGTTELHVARPVGDCLNPKFALYFFKSPRFIGEGTKKMTGSAGQKRVPKDYFSQEPIPLPPLQEQHRIVEKVDELMALCDRLEQQVGDQLEAHEVLVDTLLDALTRATEADEVAAHWARIAEHFDTLFTTESSIDKLKQTILQLAIRGRLVPQDPNEESAQSLLARLKCERQRWLDTHKEENPECKTMLRKLNSLDAPPPPFPLPKGWEVAHLIQLSKFLVDCHNKTAPYADDGIPIIRTSNIKERRFVLDELKYVNEETYRYWSRRCPPEPKDIIFTREAPMGEAAIIPQGARWCLGQRTMLIRPMLDHVQEEYLLLALTDPQLLESASEKAIGSTVKHLRVGDVEQLPIPVPPLEEQRRIVEKTDELMAVCDQLKARLGEASETRTRLAETVVEQAVN